MPTTAEKILQWSAGRLSRSGIESPRLESELLLADAIGGTRLNVQLNPHRSLTAEELSRFRCGVDRRTTREPMAYILGRREFWSLDFKVTPRVLVPRPETELLIECLLEMTAKLPVPGRPWRVLDAGTGSGILAVVAARELPLSEVTAVDLCPGALAVARENAVRHGVADKIRFIQSDLYQNLPPGVRYDFILSNPPYIPTRFIETLMADVRDHEPPNAIDGGTDGLDCYRPLVAEAGARLEPGGVLILETGFDLEGAVCRLIEDRDGFQPAKIFRDAMGCNRVIVARKQGHG